MFLYGDYFNEKLKDTHYESNREYIDEWMCLCLMILERLSSKTGLTDDMPAGSRGLGITHKEMVLQLAMPPFMRPKEHVDEVISVEVQKALEHITQRSEATSECVLPFSLLCERFKLNTIEKIGVMLAFMAKIDLRSRMLFTMVGQGRKLSEPTVGMLYEIAIAIGEDPESVLALTAMNERPARLLFSMSNDGGAGEGFDISLRLQSQAFGYISGRRIDPPDGVKELTYCSGKPDYLKKEIQQLKSAADIWVYIETDDTEAARFVATQQSRSLNKRLFEVKSGELQDKSDSSQSILEIAFWLLLTEGNLLITEADRNFMTDTSFYRLGSLYNDFLKDKSLILTGKDGGSFEYGILHIKKPDYNDRISMWKYFLRESKLAKNVDIEELADCYETPYGLIKSASSHAIKHLMLTGEKHITYDNLIEAITENDALDFEGMATRVPLVYTWDDIMMSADQKDILKTACHRYQMRNRIGDSWGLKKKNAYGNGVSILLYGPPGTGKTMAAQIIAQEVGLPLYRVDLSQIFSKYIGETEKHLSVIFDEASKANIILFFDEADALFAKRTEVSDSHDKYANTETSFLLQKMEEYKGMSILATNYYGNFDAAFMRRITYAAHLTSPSEAERLLLWKKMLPKEAPVDNGIDFEFFANNFELSPANIKSILYGAAYIAAEEKQSIGAKHIVRSMIYEYAKLGKMITAQDFGPYGGFAMDIRGRS